jgi:DNA-binding CsgD family transcriptional regulator
VALRDALARTRNYRDAWHVCEDVVMPDGKPAPGVALVGRLGIIEAEYHRRLPGENAFLLPQRNEPVAGFTRPVLRARLLLAYGEWLRRQRRSAKARAPLREARDIFDALGASPWGNRAREELRASGETSRRRTERAWETLTPQELHIAQLAAEGLSNKEIGVRLYLSHRTVGYHLRQIFAKTGITSRASLGSIVAKVENPAD